MRNLTVAFIQLRLEGKIKQINKKVTAN